VEVDSSRSNQHEFNAPKALRDAFGKEQPRRIETDFVWMPDDGEFITHHGELTWYDARARHPTRSEYRVYYRDNSVTERSTAGALLLIALRPDGTVLLVLAPGTGLAAARIAWLFGIETSPGSAFAALDIDATSGGTLLSRLGQTSAQQPPSWENQSEMIVARSDEKVRKSAAIAQKDVGAAATDEVHWDDIILEFPEPPPPEIAGAGFEHTVRGVIAPRSDTKGDRRGDRIRRGS
jgi:hypothetical protein